MSLRLLMQTQRKASIWVCPGVAKPANPWNINFLLQEQYSKIFAFDLCKIYMYIDITWFTLHLHAKFVYNVFIVYNVCVGVSEEEYEPLISFTESTSSIFLRAINPIDSRNWRRTHWGWKVLKIIQVKHL